MPANKEEQKVPAQTTSIVKEAQIYPEIQPGKIVRVHERITETNAKGEEKQRVQIFEGMVLARKHGKGINATITVKKTSDSVQVEKIYPLSSPVIDKIEVVREYKVRRAKLSFLRNYFKKLKEIKK